MYGLCIALTIYGFYHITIILITPLLPGAPALDGSECPAFCPTKCGPDEMHCWGGEDMNGCQMPDFCTPMKGGNETYLQKK